MKKRLKDFGIFNPESINNNFSDEKIKYIDISSVDGKTGEYIYEIIKLEEAPSRAKRILKKGDIIISTVRTYLKAIAFIEEDGLIGSTGFCVFRPSNKEDSSYFKYVCLANTFLDNIVKKSKGIAYPSCKTSDISDQDFIFEKDCLKRKKIVTFLDNKLVDINKDIKNKEEKISLLEELKKSEINEKVTKGLDSNVGMKDSGVDWIGMIPKHWDIVRFKDMFKIQKNKIKEYDDENILSLTLRGVVVKNNIHTNEGQLPESFNNYMKIEKGDFVMNPMDLRRGFTDCSPYEGIISPAYTSFIEKIDINKEFYKHFWQNHYRQEIFFPFGKGVSKEHRWVLTTNTLLFWPTIKAPVAEQEKIVEYLEDKMTKIDKLIEITKEEITLLKEYKKTLINDVVTGKIKVD